MIRTDIADQQVVVVTGGGSGHEPMFAGFVGKGLADAAALGEIFYFTFSRYYYRND